jgi:hypothetical protein
MNRNPDTNLEQYSDALLILLDEAFDQVHGFFLDPHDSLFETLAGINAAEASIPVGGKCATLSAQVKHVAFYLDVYVNTFHNPPVTKVDWGEIWRTVNLVTLEEWQSIQAELRTSYARLRDFIKTDPPWRSHTDLADAFAVVAHTAYHLGEIRQALCTLRP